MGQNIPKNLDDNFMEQVIKELTWKDAFPDLLLVTRVDLMSQVEIGDLLAKATTREVPADWKLVNIVLIFKKGKKQDPGNYRSVSLTSVPGKVMEIILGNIEKDNTVIGHNQHTLVRGKSCLSNLISFYYKITYLIDQGRPVDVIILDFSKAFSTVFPRILLDKMSSTQLGKHIMWWILNDKNHTRKLQKIDKSPDKQLKLLTIL
ncbi:RNA-directed DNA polymerase from mobile element jockey-like protein [Willisornis vidua]|uniref:RNA-directed DNA polymerase from mobile element jockey-like protein n=1 Tax=Willisornis vidua TaxID=1566151 RepID=A0ABQ9CXK0_9PASS|nr:RNA-directed DNA polymerase from mobile element jockey-like protein [Willisornis vidua]